LTKATTNFPIQLATFVGRDQELAEVVKLVRGSRLVTLTGMGGTGKTRLALQAGAAMADEFADGVWLVDLAPVSEPQLVVQQVASVFGVNEQPNRSLVDGMAEHFRSSQLLVVLDNCEHVVDSACQMAASLLQGTSALRVLATSREPLRLPGEAKYAVPPLGVPDAEHRLDATSVSRFDAVRLFISRGESVRPGFRLTSEATIAVVEICRRLDGIPLAIELAAARLASFSPQQIEAHLDHRFRLLTGGSRAGLARQQTLQATIDWSYALLGDRERSLFQRLSVFQSAFSLEAAQQIASGEMLDELDVIEVLPRIIDKSLIAVDPSHAEVRYRLLETLRLYASDRWQPTGEKPVVEARHAMYFLELAEEGTANLRISKHEEWMDPLKAEHDNLRQALRWSLDNAEIETGMRLARALYRFWLYNDNHSEGAWWLEALLTRTDIVHDSVRAKALLGYGTLSGGLSGKHSSRVGALREAVEMYRSMAQEQSTRLDYATALSNLGADLITTGDTIEAEACYEEALEIARALEVQWGVSIVLENLARLAALDGRIEQAWKRFDESVDEARGLGSPRRIGDALAGKATFEGDRGNLEDAIAAYEESIQAYVRAEYLSGVRWSNADMAIAYLRRDEFDRATELFFPNAAALLDDQEVVNRSFLLVDLAMHRAEIDVASGDPARAASLIGFIDGLVEAGGLADYVDRHQHLKQEIETKDGSG
jgi:predicted ATPase